MEVVKRSATPDGVKIQIEDWNGVYNFIPACSTLAAYPTAKESAGGLYLYPRRGERFRLAFDFRTGEQCRASFQALESGKKALKDYLDFLKKRVLQT